MTACIPEPRTPHTRGTATTHEVEGGPGWRIRSTDLRPVITDHAAFRTGLADDPLREEIELLWTGEADALLAGAEDSIRKTAFFRDRVVRYLTARARVASRLGDPESASGHAHAALTVLGIEGNPFPRHPGVGVPTVHADLRVELTRLAQGLRPVAVRRRSFRFPFRKGRP